MSRLSVEAPEPPTGFRRILLDCVPEPGAGGVMQTTLDDASFAVPPSHRCCRCYGPAPVSSRGVPNGICDDCLDELRRRDREAEYDNYAEYLNEINSNP